MKIVILGTEGQLAQSFRKLTTQLANNTTQQSVVRPRNGTKNNTPPIIDLFSLNAQSPLSKCEFIFLKRDQIDFSQPEKVLAQLEFLKPNIVINSAAYTAVDKAETEKELAYQINALTPIRISHWCKENNALMIHYSTDYVFDGSGVEPKSENDPTNPVNYYGFTKRASEEGILQSGCPYLIFRISWVYNEVGTNFVKTMLRLGSQREELKIVNDQVGYPSYAQDIAGATLQIIENCLLQNIENGLVSLDNEKTSQPTFFKVEWPREIYHLSSHTHATSWFQFAQTIFQYGKELGFSLVVKNVIPITSAEFPTPAKRPLNSRLNSEKIRNGINIVLPDWKNSLLRCMQEMKKLESKETQDSGASTSIVKTAVILAGGKGTRLGAETAHLPKPMIDIEGKPLLQWQIEWLKDQGIHKVFFLTGHLSDVIEKHFKDGSQFGVKIEYVIEKEPLGTAGALAQLEPQIKEPFYVIYGDLFLNLDLSRINQFHTNTKGMGVLVVHPNDHPHDSDLVVVGDNSRITSMLPKPRPAGYYQNLVNAAVYLFEPTVFKYLRNRNGQDLARDVFPELVQKESVYAYSTPEYLKDMGTPDRLAKVRNDVKIKKPLKWCLTQPRPTAFIDRDGVICKHVPFLDDINDFELINGVPEAIRKLNQAGWLTIVVTNQSMLAMGKITQQELQEIHNKMETQLGDQGAWLDHIFYCPHHPDKGHEGEVPELKIICDCRKPETGMIKQAMQIYNVDLAKSVMIGDSWRDILLGKKMNFKTLGVKGGEGFIDKKTMAKVEPDIICETLLEAVNKVLA